MSDKRRRKRPSAEKPGRDAAASPKAESAGRAKGRPAEDRGPSASPFPPLGASLARGLRSVGAWPVVLVTAFLSLVVTWAVFVLIGVESTPRFLAVVMAISPAHLFSDVPAIFGTPQVSAILVAAGSLTVVRAVTFGLLISLIADALGGRPDLRAALRALPRRASALAAIYLVEAGVVFLLVQLVAGVLGQLAPLVVAAAIYLLAYVFVVAVVDDEPLQTAFRRGVRASRLPGIRHLSLSLLYFVFLFYTASVSPFGPLAPATPSLLTWAFGLAMTFLHAGVLGALVYRWLAVRDQVPAEAAGARR